jgi:hypothetical protein
MAMDPSNAKARATDKILERVTFMTSPFFGPLKAEMFSEYENTFVGGAR